jgi:hypothetical protein
MKRERRHELQHNDLAEWIVKNYERIVPYKNAILGVGLLAIVLVIALWAWQSHRVAQSGEAWNSFGIPVFQPQFMNEQTIGAMEHTVQTYPDTPAAEWAKVFAGDCALMIGTNKLLTDKKVGTEYLAQARDRYIDAVKTLTIPAAKQRAMFGKARAIESLIENETQLDQALAAYQELNDRFPEGMFKALATQQIEQLQKKDTLTFCRALARYTPKPKAESPQRQLEKLGPLSENPPDEPGPPKPAVQGGGNQPASKGQVPEPSLTPKTPVNPNPAKKETPKADATKPQTAEPDVPPPEAPKAKATKTEAAKAEPAKTEAVKKDK